MAEFICSNAVLAWENASENELGLISGSIRTTAAGRGRDRQGRSRFGLELTLLLGHLAEQTAGLVAKVGILLRIALVLLLVGHRKLVFHGQPFRATQFVGLRLIEPLPALADGFVVLLLAPETLGPVSEGPGHQPSELGDTGRLVDDVLEATQGLLCVAQGLIATALVQPAEETDEVVLIPLDQTGKCPKCLVECLLLLHRTGLVNRGPVEVELCVQEIGGRLLRAEIATLVGQFRIALAGEYLW